MMARAVSSWRDLPRERRAVRSDGAADPQETRSAITSRIPSSPDPPERRCGEEAQRRRWLARRRDDDDRRERRRGDGEMRWRRVRAGAKRRRSARAASSDGGTTAALSEVSRTAARRDGRDGNGGGSTARFAGTSCNARREAEASSCRSGRRCAVARWRRRVSVRQEVACGDHGRRRHGA